MIYIPDILLTIFYACFGILLMLTANTVIDFFVPGKFSKAIKNGNCAVAWLSAGSFIGIGQILRAVIMSPAVGPVDTSLLPKEQRQMLPRNLPTSGSQHPMYADTLLNRFYR